MPFADTKEYEIRPYLKEQGNATTDIYRDVVSGLFFSFRIAHCTRHVFSQ